MLCLSQKTRNIVIMGDKCIWTLSPVVRLLKVLGCRDYLIPKFFEVFWLLRDKAGWRSVRLYISLCFTNRALFNKIQLGNAAFKSSGHYLSSIFLSQGFESKKSQWARDILFHIREIFPGVGLIFILFNRI